MSWKAQVGALRKVLFAGVLCSTIATAQSSLAQCPTSGPIVSIDPSYSCVSAHLVWSAVTNAAYYSVSKRLNDGSDPPHDWVFIGNTTSTFYDVPTTSLGQGTWEDFKVESAKTGCDFVSSNVVTFVVPALPTTPSGTYSQQLSEGQVKVGWATSGSGQNAVARVYCDGSPVVDRTYNLGSVTFQGVCGSHNYSVSARTLDSCATAPVPAGSGTTTTTTVVLSAPADGATITSPNVTLSWAAAPCASNYNVQVASDIGFTHLLVNTNVGGTSYPWSAAPCGTSYWRVQANNGAPPAPSWSSTRSFTQPTLIAVGSPNGGETVYVGSTVNVTWTNSCGSSTVRLDYSTNGGASWTTIASNIPNTQSYAWTVPPVETSSGRIRVWDASLTSYDDSDASFTIAVTPVGSTNFEWTRDWLTIPALYPATAVEPGLTVDMTYRGSNGLYLAARTSSCSWQPELIEADGSQPVGSRSAIAIGAQHVAGVVYLRQVSSGYDVCYRRGDYLSPGDHYWGSTATVIGHTSVLNRPSIAFDASGIAHIAFTDGTSLRYGEVNVRTLTTSPLETISTLAKAGQDAISLAIDGTGATCVAFSIDDGTYPIAIPSLGYARRSGGAWTAQASQTVTSLGGFGARLALDAQGQPHIACWSNNSKLLYGAWSNANSAWTFTIVTDFQTEPPIAMTLDASGLARIALLNLTGGEVPTYVRETTGAPRWEASVFDTANVNGQNWSPGIGLETNGSPIIGYTAIEGNIVALAVAQAATGTPDVTPPAAVTNLSVVTGKTTAVPSWTATGDDGSTGTAANYDLRYSSAPINTDADFWNATPITGLICPSASGTTDCATLSGLAKCSPYYFRLKVRDNAGNWSGLSNAASGVTKCSGSEVLCDQGGFSAKPSVGQDTGSPVPTELAFRIMSPNPTRTTTALRLEIPSLGKDRELQVAVFDTQGRRIRSLLDEVAQPGARTITWDLRNSEGAHVSHGVYFIRLRMGSSSLVRTVIVTE